MSGLKWVLGPLLIVGGIDDCRGRSCFVGALMSVGALMHVGGTGDCWGTDEHWGADSLPCLLWHMPMAPTPPFLRLPLLGDNLLSALTAVICPSLRLPLLSDDFPSVLATAD